jgi:CRP-like cAMP-binding protein
MCTNVYVVKAGEFEVCKKMKNDLRKKQEFDMMEFLPQKKNKNFKYNIKNNRFIKAVNSFKFKGAGDGQENMRLMIIGVGNLIGEEDAIKDRYYSTSVKCFSQTGSLYSITMENFHKVVKATDEDTWVMMEKNAL